MVIFLKDMGECDYDRNMVIMTIVSNHEIICWPQKVLNFAIYTVISMTKPRSPWHVNLVLRHDLASSLRYSISMIT